MRQTAYIAIRVQELRPIAKVLLQHIVHISDHRVIVTCIVTCYGEQLLLKAQLGHRLQHSPGHILAAVATGELLEINHLLLVPEGLLASARQFPAGRHT